MTMNRSREMMVDFASAIRQFATLGIIDALVVVVSYAATLSVRVWNTSLEVSSGFYAIALAAIITPFIFYAFHIYHCIWEYSSGAEGARISRATATMTAVVFIFSASFSPRPLPLSVVLFSLIPVTCGVAVVRYRRRVLSGFS